MKTLALFALMVVSLFAEPSLRVEPSLGMADEPLTIRVSGAAPFQRVSLRAEMAGSRGEIWSSHAFFDADERGEIDMASAEPIEGSYEGADSMGLVWSMRSEGAPLFRLSKARMEIAFSLALGEETVQVANVSRTRSAEGIERISVREDGLVADLFLPRSEAPLPAVIVLGGSSGGLSDGRAQLLASHGVAALSLAYFGCEGLPSSLKEIPLEYFEKALDWLREREAIDPKRIGVWGTSRGGELALLLGTAFPEKIQAIAAFVPSSALYGAIDETDAPAWTYRGEKICPNAPFPAVGFGNGAGRFSTQAISLTPLFLSGMEDAEAFEAARIPVEKIGCPVLLVSGQDDRMWPSDLFCRQMAAKISNCVHLSYPGAGHHISPPCVPTTSNADFHPFAKLWVDFGGSPRENARAQSDSWKQTIEFFQRHLFFESASKQRT
jgi:dienelactone hydrolase